MLVKLLVARAAATGSQNRGEVVEVNNGEAARMIEAGQAEPVREGKAPEKAVRSGKKPEKATK